MKQCNYERTKRVEQYGLGNILKEKHEIIQAYKKATTEATTKLYQDSLARKKRKHLELNINRAAIDTASLLKYQDRLMSKSLLNAVRGIRQY